MKKAVAMLLVVLFTTGCFTLKSVAPTGASVTTLSETQSASVRKDVKVWYALWGLVPITNNASDMVIAQHKLKQARVTTQMTFVDVVIGLFTGIVTIYPITMTVEGNQ